MNKNHPKKLETINICLLQPHPLNAEIYGSSTGDDEELRRAIINNKGELIHDPVVHLRHDGEYRILSGHRRIKIIAELGYEALQCVVWEGLSDADEMLILFGGNVGRDMKIAYKVHFFSALKQFLRQYKNMPDLSDTCDDAEVAEHPFVHAVDGAGILNKKLRIWEIAESLTGFSKREQETLTHVCDKHYRHAIVSAAPAGCRASLLMQWQRLEEGVVAGEITLAKASNMVKSLQKQIDSINNPAPMPKPKKSHSASALKSEKSTEVDASIYANTSENVTEWLIRQSEFQDTGASIGFRETANLCVAWANAVIEEAK